MREILFRGKRKDNGEWVEGIPIKMYDTEIGLKLPLRYNPKNITLMNTDRVELCCAMDGSAYFDTENYPIVDDNTICQYTRLKDKNNKKIFEGDVIKNKGYNFSVYWDDEYAGFYPFYDQDHPAGYGVIGEESEVIGNIHDNPELLEGEK